MSQIIITTIGSSGSIFPFVRVGSELIRRRHQVTLISNCKYERIAREGGLEFRALDTQEECEQFISDTILLNGPEGFAKMYKRYFLPNVIKEVRIIQELIVAGDTILVARSQPSIAALLAAEKFELPLVSSFLAPSFVSTIPLFEQLFNSLFLEEINQIRRELGMSEQDSWRYWMNPVQYSLGLWPEWYGADEAEGLSLAGFVFSDKQKSSGLPDAIQEFLTRHPNPVLITGGTGTFVDASFYQVAVEGCNRIGVPAIVVTQDGELISRNLSPRVIWARFVPFEDITPHLGAAIHHGGIGTAAEMLAAAVPQLIMGVGADRPDNAARLKKLGVAEYLPQNQWHPGQVEESLRRLLSDEVRSHALAGAGRIEHNGTEKAASLIERFLLGEEKHSANGGARQVFTRYVGSQGNPKGRNLKQFKACFEGLSTAKRSLLETRLRAIRAKNGEDRIVKLPREKENSYFPLSFGQQRLWFLDQLMPGSSAYNIASAVRIRGELAVEVLERAVEELVRRHEVLRTTIEVREGKAVQVIHSGCGVKVAVMSLEGQERGEQEMRLKEMGLREGQEPFDLERGPLIRVKLVKIGAQEHVLFLTMHHIVSDGWSMGVLVRELGQLYEAFLKGEASPLKALPVQYADYAVWQRGWLQGEVLAEQMGYWREQLRGIPEIMELPTDRPRPAVQRQVGAVEGMAVDWGTLEGLKALSQREGATLFMVLMAAFKVLLYRYSGQRDIVVGTPIANRKRGELEGLIGFFVNTLALRTDLSGDPTFQELLKREREVALGAYGHQDIPFEQLVAELRPERNLGHSPIFQVMLALQNAPEGAVEIGGLEFEAMGVEQRSAKFDLTMVLIESAQGMSGVLEYNTDLFDRGTMERMARHWERLLEGVVKEAGMRIGELEILSKEERRQILEEWNGSVVEYPKEKCVHELFEEQAGRTPDAIALVFEGQQLTYGELNNRSNQLAWHLRRMGVGPEVLVGICMERSLEMVIGLLGILKAGGAYVPLDPQYPKERLAFMLEDSGVTVLLTQAHLVGTLPATNARFIRLDADWPVIAGENGEMVKSGVKAEDLAYLIYTSGSTGRPKGAMNTHRGIVNRLLWMQDEYRLSATDRVLQKTSFSFDVSVWEFFWPLLTGARLVLVRPGGHKDGVYLGQLIGREKITTLHFVPSMLQVFWNRKV